MTSFKRNPGDMPGIIDSAIVSDLLNRRNDKGASLFNQLVEIFFESATERISQLKEAVGEPVRLTFVAHAFKGISRSLGASRLGSLCHQLETRAQSLTAAEQQQLIEEVERTFAETRIEFIRLKE